MPAIAPLNLAPALILFDIDGTLVRRAGPHHRQALVDAVRRVTGLETSTDGIPVHGMLDPDIPTRMLRNVGASPASIRRAMPEIVRRAQHVYVRSVPNLQRKTCPGVRPLLRRLQEHGVLLGLVTGNLTRIGWKKLDRRPEAVFPLRSLRPNGQGSRRTGPPRHPPGPRARLDRPPHPHRAGGRRAQRYHRRPAQRHPLRRRPYRNLDPRRPPRLLPRPPPQRFAKASSTKTPSQLQPQTAVATDRRFVRMAESHPALRSFGAIGAADPCAGAAGRIGADAEKPPVGDPEPAGKRKNA